MSADLAALQDQVHQLRATVLLLMETSANVRTIKAMKAHDQARAVWLATTPEADKQRAIAKAQSMNPDIKTFDEAVKEYGTYGTGLRC